MFCKKVRISGQEILRLVCKITAEYDYIGRSSIYSFDKLRLTLSVKAVMQIGYKYNAYRRFQLVAFNGVTGSFKTGIAGNCSDCHGDNQCNTTGNYLLRAF